MKVLFLVATYFVAVTIIFILPRIIPGNPLASLLAQISKYSQTSPEAIKGIYDTLMREFNIEKPLWEQYIDFLARTFTGDLGTSITFYPRKVMSVIASALPWTLGLLVPATLSSWIIGNVLGALAGYKRDTLFEKAIITSTFMISQIPYYWFAMILIFVFAAELRLFPTGGAYSFGTIPGLSLNFIIDVLWHYALPFLALTTISLGAWASGMRVLIIYELRSDYILFSESLGIPDRVLFSYAFRNSVIPRVTGLALALGSVAGRALITEALFTYPGALILLQCSA